MHYPSIKTMSIQLVRISKLWPYIIAYITAEAHSIFKGSCYDNFLRVLKWLPVTHFSLSSSMSMKLLHRFEPLYSQFFFFFSSLKFFPHSTTYKGSPNELRTYLVFTHFSFALHWLNFKEKQSDLIFSKKKYLFFCNQLKYL